MEKASSNFKSFDGIIENDKRGNFLIEATPFCFKKCIDKITEEAFSTEKTECFEECYSKLNYAYNK